MPGERGQNLLLKPRIHVERETPKAGDRALDIAGGTGDLFVTIRITLPDGNDAELEALMQKWRDGHPYNPRSDLG